jgi:hypothetical protein
MDAELRNAFDNTVDHIDSLKGDLVTLKGDVTNIKNSMATKDDLESLRADMVTKEDLEKAIERLRVA